MTKTTRKHLYHLISDVCRFAIKANSIKTVSRKAKNIFLSSGNKNNIATLWQLFQPETINFGHLSTVKETHFAVWTVKFDIAVAEISKNWLCATRFQLKRCSFTVFTLV